LKSVFKIDVGLISNAVVGAYTLLRLAHIKAKKKCFGLLLVFLT